METDRQPVAVQDRPAPGQGTAFFSVQLGERTWLVDLPRGQSEIGRKPDCRIHLDSAEVLPCQATLDWDGDRLLITPSRGKSRVFLNGKPLTGLASLSPGDELSIGPAVLIAGVSSAAAPPRRRALTHDLFRERVVEQLSGAARTRRPVSLAMIRCRTGGGRELIASALATFRTGDPVASFAPDEAEVLFPETPAELASVVAERAIRNSGLEGWSLGMASAPADGDDADRLIRAARCALRGAQVRGAEPLLSPEVAAIAEDPSWQAVLARLAELAQADGPMLLTGEANTGKRLLARRFHLTSRHAAGPFEALFAPGLSPEAAQTAFSDAPSSAWTRARGGILFIAGLGKLDSSGQVALRQALERGDGPQVVASSRLDLEALTRRGAFDARLLELLSPRSLRLPPLRERPADIAPLALHFASEAGAARPRLTPGALSRVRTYPWPGNLLELCNAIERAVCLAGENEIRAEHLPGEAAADEEPGRLREQVDFVERDAIARALAETNFNQTHAAKKLGLSRRALIYKMERYGLKPPPGSARRK